MTDPRAIEWAFLPARATLVSFAVATTAAQALTDAGNIGHEADEHFRYVEVDEKHCIAEVDGDSGAWLATDSDELVIDAEANR